MRYTPSHFSSGFTIKTAIHLPATNIHQRQLNIHGLGDDSEVRRRSWLNHFVNLYYLIKIAFNMTILIEPKPTTRLNCSFGLKRLYRGRFAAVEIAKKDRVWAILCRDFFSRFVKRSDRVLDIAAGYCEFINNINCAQKYAYDANPDTARFAAQGVTVVLGDCREMSALPLTSFDVVFVSNFFEHLESKSDIDKVLIQVFERLRPGGRLLVLQPNIRYLGSRYWDFYDHTTPLTHLSLREALLKNGFEVELLFPKFLPYTFKSRIPSAEWLVRLYLRLRPAWWVLGKQMFAVAVRPVVGSRAADSENI
jgi:SAM-dependent methyltransferase